MRVGLVVYGSLDTTTGGYLYDRQLVEYLRAQGDTVAVVSLPPRSYATALAHNLADNLASLIPPDHPHTSPRLAGGAVPSRSSTRSTILERLADISDRRRGRRSRGVAQRLADLDVDVLLQDELCHPSLLAGHRRCPVVSVVHLLRSDEHRGSALRPLYAAVERRYLTRVDGAVFNSDSTRRSAERLVGRPIPGVVARPAADHLRVPDTTAAAPVGAPLRVISVANVVPGKGLLVLVDALARLPADSWRLTVVGSLTTDPAYVARVRRRIADSGIAEQVELLGEVANADVPAHLARHDVLAVPSSYEAAGIAYLEAMRMGLPVIATTAGGAGELVADGVEGFLVAPDDVDALVDRLRTWVSDRELVARMGAAACQRAERHPTWAESFGPVRALLTSLMNRSRAPARSEASS
jgi:glycosyltransferase involved in cell wall biosynthesis